MIHHSRTAAANVAPQLPILAISPEIVAALVAGA